MEQIVLWGRPTWIMQLPAQRMTHVRGKDPGGGAPGARRACDDGKQEDDARGK